MESITTRVHFDNLLIFTIQFDIFEVLNGSGMGQLSSSALLLARSARGEPLPRQRVLKTVPWDHSLKCLSLDKPRPENGVNFGQWTCDGADIQQYKVTKNEDGRFKRVNKYSNNVVDVAGISADSGVTIHWNWFPTSRTT